LPMKGGAFIRHTRRVVSGDKIDGAQRR